MMGPLDFRDPVLQYVFSSREGAERFREDLRPALVREVEARETREARARIEENRRRSSE